MIGEGEAITFVWRPGPAQLDPAARSCHPLSDVVAVLTRPRIPPHASSELAQFALCFVLEPPKFCIC